MTEEQIIKQGTQLQCPKCQYSWTYAPRPDKRKYKPEVPRKYTSCPFCKSQVITKAKEETAEA